MVRDTETPGTRTIWEDNYKGFNYRLFFEGTADDNAPERVVLVKRTENVPRETILWQFDFCSVDKMEAAFSALNTMLSALAENVETKCSIKTFAFVEAFPDFTGTPLKNGTLTAKVTKNGTEVTNCKFHVINGKVYANTIALEWVNDLSTFLTVSDNLQVITCIGTDAKLDAISDYSVSLSYDEDRYIEDYIANNVTSELSVIKEMPLQPAPSVPNGTVNPDGHGITWNNFTIGGVGTHYRFTSIQHTSVIGNFLFMHVMGTIDTIVGNGELASMNINPVYEVTSARVTPFIGSCILKVKNTNTGGYELVPAHIECMGNSASILTPFLSDENKYIGADFDIIVTCVVL